MRQSNPAKSGAPYRGRFAPSPTGPLHFGSLVTALGSYAEARAHGGTWLVRMEDLDRPRLVPGAADAILRALEAFGFEWDEPVLYQNQRTKAYEDALTQLHALGLTYNCICSRRQIAANAILGPEGPIYPGTCRARQIPTQEGRATRLHVNTQPLAFHDAIQGIKIQDIQKEVGDFVLRRADGLFAYQLAVVVDDAYQGISHVIRGADLCRSTPRQILLQGYLKLPTPAYAHLPVVLDHQGHKLSKSAAAAPVDPDAPLPALLQAWDFLGQPAFPEPPGTVAQYWRMALHHWNLARVPNLAGAKLS